MFETLLVSEWIKEKFPNLKNQRRFDTSTIHTILIYNTTLQWYPIELVIIHHYLDPGIYGFSRSMPRAIGTHPSIKLYNLPKIADPSYFIELETRLKQLINQGSNQNEYTWND